MKYFLPKNVKINPQIPNINVNKIGLLSIKIQINDESKTFQAYFELAFNIIWQESKTSIFKLEIKESLHL